MPLLRGIARTAAVAGTATAVSNRSAGAKGQRWQAKAEQERRRPPRRPPAPAPPPPPPDPGPRPHRPTQGPRRAEEPGHPHRRRVRGAEGQVLAGTERPVAAASMRPARYSASSLTQPSRAEPRVCCHGQAEEVQAGAGGDAALVHEAAGRRRTPARGSSSGRARSRWPRSPRPARAGCRRRTHVDAGRADGAPVEVGCPARRAARGLEPISVSRSLQPPADARGDRSCASARWRRGSGTGRGRGCAAAAASGATPIERCTSWVRGELLGDLEAGVAAADDQHRARRDGRPACGTRCCAAARRAGRAARRARARAGPGTGPWRSRPGRPRSVRSSSSTR